MSQPADTYRPGPQPGTVRSAAGQVLSVPAGWVLVPPGDAALTRRIKAAGPHWKVEEKVGRRTFSQGVWAPAETVETLRAQLARERAEPGHALKQEAAKRRRTKIQTAYVDDFQGAVVEFLAFAPPHEGLARSLAEAVTRHATPVGSGTVARTQRIPINRRAEAAVIAWMRHQTTGYDTMVIPRGKGKRREVRRMLAQRSKELLAHYRQGRKPQPGCPLAGAIAALAGPNGAVFAGDAQQVASPLQERRNPGS